MKTRQLFMTLVLMLMMPLGIWAQNFESGTTKIGSVSEKVQEQWYTLDLTDDGEAQITVQELSNMRLRSVVIYTVSGEENRWRAEASENAGVASLTCSNLAKGIYKVKVSGYPRSNGSNGTFQISYTFVTPALKNDPEPNNEWSDASMLTDAESQSGHLGYDYYYSMDGTDWYKIEVPADGQLTFQIKSDMTLRLGSMKLYTLKADGTDVNFRTEKDMDGYGKDTTIVLEVPNVSKGTYYVMLNRFAGYGAYQLTYYFTQHSEIADPEPNNTWEEAIELKSGPSVTGQLGYDYHFSTDGTDWYKIEVPDEGAVTFSTTTEKTLRLGSMKLYTQKADGTDVNFRTEKDMDGYAKDTTIVFTISNIAPGTYYVMLNRYTGYGTYTLQYTFNANSKQPDPEPNNEWANASLIENRKRVEGRLGYDYHFSTDKTDWYKIEVPDEGAVTFSTTTEKTLRLGSMKLYTLKADETDVNYRTEKDMDGYGKDTTIVFTISNIAPGTYYVMLNHYGGYGGYQLNYDFTPNAHGNDSFDNDTWDKALELANGSNQPGRLGYDYYYSTDRIDWYKIEVEADGEIVFAVTSEKTLRLGSMKLHTLKADGTDVNYRTEKDMDGYGKDTTIVFTISNIAPGTYYVMLNHFGGYGGYQLAYHFNKNPYSRNALDNTTAAKALKLEEGKTVYTTLGYDYYYSTNNEDWYDLGTFGKDVIDVTINPDTTKALIIGVVDWYKWDGTYDDKGNLRLIYLKGDRVERSRITTSYQNNEEGAHLFLKVPRYNGYGGYTILLGEAEDGSGKNPVMAAGYAGLRVMMGGRNTLRKGVPCENTITISNMSDTPTIPSSLVLSGTNNINIIGFRMPSNNGTTYYPAEEVLVEGEDCQNTAVFYIPSLAPWQTYTFTMIAEGEGDIAYAPFRVDEEGNLVSNRSRLEPATTALLLGFIIDVGWDIVEDKLGIDHFFSRTAGEAMSFNEEEERQYCQFIGLTREQFREEQPGTGAYVAKAVVKRACVNAIDKIPVLGKAINLAGNTLEIMQNIIPNLRRRLWLWIYKDLGYIKDDLEVKDGKQGINDIVGSWDPNEMIGPAGVGEQHYINGETQTINYTILFENKAEAGDAAYRVRINDELDENVFDVSTVRFGETSHDGVGYNWEMKREGNKISWDIKGIELPPNVNAPEGEGFVTFSVDLKPGLADGTQIKNKATIIFDKNFPIETNEFVNTIDSKAPVTTMKNVRYDAEQQNVIIFCDSHDNASGVDSYMLFASKDGGDYTYEGQFPSVARYPVAPGDNSTYSFYVLATDAVGNTEYVVPEALTFNYVTGIQLITADQKSIPTDGKVYTVDGRYLGTLNVSGFSLQSLPTGIYIVGGQKVHVK